jgi:serine/threonine protein kinase
MIPPELVPGTLVGPWFVQERLDRGNYGVVFRAQRAGHPESPSVALKMARNPRDPRFEREGLLLQRMPRHPSIPRYEDSGLWTAPSDYRYPYVVMELVEGLTLYDWFEEQQRSSRQVLAVLSQLASALAIAHTLGAVHRDVKGDNIRVTTEGRAALLDWGSGWFAGARPLTDTLAPPGTTPYRPPEQRLFMWRFRKDLEARWQAQPSDDLYALGVTLYRLVTGGYLPPFTDGGEPAEREVLRPSAMATVCPELEAVILRLIAEDRNARGTAEQLVREVEGLVQAAGPDADKPIRSTVNAMPTEEGFSSSDGYQDEELLSDTDEAAETSDDPPKREERPPASEPPPPKWLSLACAAAVGGLVVFLGGKLHGTVSHQEPATPPWIATPEEMSQFEEVPQFAPDAGVSEEALSTAQEMPRAALPTILSLGRPMPSKPFPGQRRPPCEPRVEREIIGACWIGPLGDEKPPCGNKMFDYEDRCYLASFNEARQPTSNQP